MSAATLRRLIVIGLIALWEILPRAGFIPGTHTIGFDAHAETLELVHTVRDRATFAHGALAAARWVAGKKGWFTMRDVLGLSS